MTGSMNMSDLIFEIEEISLTGELNSMIQNQSFRFDHIDFTGFSTACVSKTVKTIMRDFAWRFLSIYELITVGAWLHAVLRKVPNIYDSELNAINSNVMQNMSDVAYFNDIESFIVNETRMFLQFYKDS
jgi:hypothetical protein